MRIPWLPAGPLRGVPDAWPHVADALRGAGYYPDPREHREALYGGWLTSVPAPADPPIDGLTVQCVVGTCGTRFRVLFGDQELGCCGVVTDLTHRRMSPALQGWAWLDDLLVQEGWRNRGIGGWLVKHAIAWLRLAGCDRVVLAVADDDETAGAGRFYQRFGWRVFARETHGWIRDVPTKSGKPGQNRVGKRSP